MFRNRSNTMPIMKTPLANTTWEVSKPMLKTNNAGHSFRMKSFMKSKLVVTEYGI